MSSGNPGNPDQVVEALDSLVEALTQNIEASETAIERARTVMDLRTKGLGYRDIADEAGAPTVVRLITENLERLRIHGAQLRQAQAVALHDEGMTMDEIAELYGVTRQRISALLRSARRSGDGDR